MREAYRAGKAVTGIKIGSGGFAVRGVVPAKAPDGRQLGSVETLRNFESILSAAAQKGRNELILYLNAEFPPIAPPCRIHKKNPRVDDSVRVTIPREDSLTAAITPALLTENKTETVFENHGTVSLAAPLIKDYKGDRAGVLVCERTSSACASLAAIMPRRLTTIRRNVFARTPTSSLYAMSRCSFRFSSETSSEKCTAPCRERVGREL